MLILATVAQRYSMDLALDTRRAGAIDHLRPKYGMNMILHPRGRTERDDESQFTSQAAQRFYDALASRYDWFSLYEARAKRLAVDCMKLAPGNQF